MWVLAPAGKYVAEERSVNSSAPPPSLGRSENPGPLPRVFGRYVLFDQIGRGGMADIYLARADTSLGGSRLCVVKQILPELGRDGTFEKLLIEEAKLAARLTHANVVQVFDLGREGDRLYLGMEYVEGFDMNQLLRALSKSRVALPAEFAIFMVRETLRALDYAHRLKDPSGQLLGLVHRDVSPSNVLTSFEGEVKLCDFGIARALSARDDSQHSALPLNPKVVGKSAYMAPEHARGEPIDARADVFAAGILLWELAAGRRLYKGSEEEMLALAKQAKVPPLPERGLPEQATLQTVLDKALARFRDERFQTAAEFLRALEEYAMSTKLMASQLRFGSFLTDNFANEILQLRRERERAARAMPSQVPPAPPPAFAAPSASMSASASASASGSASASAFAALPDHDYGDDESPTTIADTPLRDSGPPKKKVEQGAMEATNPRKWNEPGSIHAPQLPVDSGRIQLTELGSVGETPESSVLRRNMPDSELERSLMGLDALAEETKAEAALRASSAPLFVHFEQPPQSEWLWYAAGLLIVGLAVLAYLWT